MLAAFEVCYHCTVYHADLTAVLRAI